jgi:hypothetical protein
MFHPDLITVPSANSPPSGSNRTQLPMRKGGILPAFANLKIVILETLNKSVQFIFAYIENTYLSSDWWFSLWRKPP